MGVERFEDLVASQKARELTMEVYRMTRTAPFCHDFGLRDQVQRAAVSIMSNLAEGFERGCSAEFHQCVVVAKASCAELRSQLYVALDAGYLSEKEFRRAGGLAEEVSRIIGGLKVAVKKRRDSVS